MSKLRSEQPQHRDAIEKVLPDVEAAFTGPAFWTAFVKPAHAAGISRVSEWLNTTGRVVEEQFGRRGLRSKRPADMPLSTSPLNVFINRVGAELTPTPPTPPGVRVRTGRFAQHPGSGGRVR